MEHLWENYVSQAVPHDRWVSLARAHLARAHSERLAAEKRARALPPKTGSEGE